jgi:hypothetical protein
MFLLNCSSENETILTEMETGPYALDGKSAMKTPLPTSLRLGASSLDLIIISCYFLSDFVDIVFLDRVLVVFNATPTVLFNANLSLLNILISLFLPSIYLTFSFSFSSTSSPPLSFPSIQFSSPTPPPSFPSLLPSSSLLPPFKSISMSTTQILHQFYLPVVICSYYFSSPPASFQHLFQLFHPFLPSLTPLLLVFNPL